MQKRSAGILVYRVIDQKPQVLLVHPGGPFYSRKDAGVWSVPKGEYSEEEDPLSVAKREFNEETGNTISPSAKVVPLQPVTIKSGKQITVWAVETNFESPYLLSNTFEIEWPPRSGKTQVFPEADKAEWFHLNEAMEKIHPGQAGILQQLQSLLS